MNIDAIQVATPQYGYTISIQMLVDSVVKSNGTLSMYDYGKSNDRYSCQFRIKTERDTDIENIMHSKGVHTFSDLQDFRPFGNHWNLSSYSVAVNKYVPSQNESLAEIWTYDIGITCKTALSISDIPPQSCFWGEFSFGALSNLQEPVITFSREYDIITSNNSGASVFQTYRGDVADMRRITLEFTVCEDDAHKLLHYIVTAFTFAKILF
jgi:hypothetical protein